LRLMLRLMLRALLEMLRLRLMLGLLLRLLRRLVLRLLILLFARIESLRLRRVGLAADMRWLVAIVIVVVGLITRRAAWLLLKVGLGLTKLFLRGGDQAEIMFGVLIIIFGSDGIARALRVAGKLEIFFGDMRSRSPDFYVLPVGLVHSRQRILVVVSATLSVTTAHAFVLSVSHDLFFRQPGYLPRHRRRCFCSLNAT
jgi:hypothetical protein